MNRFLRLLLLVVLLPLSCARAQDTTKSDDTTNAYMQLWGSAQSSKDPEYIKAAIKTMREKYMNTTPKILSIYYNMAVLYRKIGLNDDAVKVMKEDKDPSSGLMLATLLLRIGRAEEAQGLFKSYQAELESELTNKKLDIKAKESIVESIFLIVPYLDEDKDKIARDIVDSGWLPSDDVEAIQARTNISKDELLAGTWPD